jgi:putative flippase GtrA
MLSTEMWPPQAIRAWTLAQRFQKFLIVGAIGLGVNAAMLFILYDLFQLRLSVASPMAILVSMVMTFFLNELWTWHDRGGGRIATRATLYAAVNSGGLVINTAILLYVGSHSGMHHQLANLIGAGVAALWNFALNHFITWRA